MLSKMLARNGRTKEDFSKRSTMGQLFRRHGVEDTPELRRIMYLPRRTWKEDTNLDLLCEQLTEWLKRPEGTMKLRPVQAKAIEEMHDYRGLLAPIRVGGGKTLTSFLAPIVLGAERPLLIVPAKLRNKTLVEFAELRKHWLFHPRMKILSYEKISRDGGYEVIEEINPDLIIADECFPGNTKVHTPSGGVPISNLKRGDRVSQVSASGRICSSKIKEIFISKAHTFTELGFMLDGDTHKVISTPNHPFLTPTGWKKAEDIKNGDTVVCHVRKRKSKNKRGSVLWAEVLRFMENAATGNESEVDQSRELEKDIDIHEEEICRRLNGTQKRVFEEPLSDRQPHEKVRDTCKSLKQATGNRPHAVCARGQREANARASANTEYSVKMGDGVCCKNRKGASRLSDLLQNRHSQSFDESGYRGRRPESPESKGSKSRRKETETFGELRLARVTDTQCGYPEQFGIGNTVYNLEVEGTHTYILAESGAIVHNCHKAKSTQTGITRKLRRWRHEHPDTKWCLMSGTITSRSLRDYSHLSEWALRELSPLPTKGNIVSDWADALDEKVDPMRRLKPGALIGLCSDEEIKEISEKPDTCVDVVRRAYRRRFTETPSVVATDERALGVSLLLNHVCLDLSNELSVDFKRLREEWETPDGWPFTEAVDLWRHARELCVFGFYRWDPRAPEPWLEARREWSRFVRQTLSARRKGIDTMFQVVRACREGQIDSTLYDAWVRLKDTFEPNTVPVWRHSKTLDHAEKWLRKEEGICWVEHVTFGKELARRSGFPYFGEGGVDKMTGKVIEQASGPVIASIASNSEGRNLQKWNKSLVVSCPTGGKVFEQMLGRCHREGQLADEVEFTILFACIEQWRGFRQSEKDAQYVQDTTGAPQKLLYADKDLMSHEKILELANSGNPLWQEV